MKIVFNLFNTLFLILIYFQLIICALTLAAWEKEALVFVEIESLRNSYFVLLNVYLYLRHTPVKYPHITHNKK